MGRVGVGYSTPQVHLVDQVLSQREFVFHFAVGVCWKEELLLGLLVVVASVGERILALRGLMSVPGLGGLRSEVEFAVDKGGSLGIQLQNLLPYKGTYMFFLLGLFSVDQLLYFPCVVEAGEVQVNVGVDFRTLFFGALFAEQVLRVFGERCSVLLWGGGNADR